MLPRTLRILVPFLALGASACAADGSPEEPCTGKCDDPETPEATAPIVSCWIVKGESADDFFRSDELHCRYRPEAADPVLLHGASFDIVKSDGQRSGAFLEEEADTTRVASFFADDYPIELELGLTYNATQQEVLGLRDLFESGTRIALAAPEEAPEDAPVTVSLPFDIWDLTLMNRHEGEVRLKFGHEIPMEPEPYVAEAGMQAFDFGLQQTARLAVPRGAASLPATLERTEGEAEVSLQGPGIYMVGGEGELSRVEPGDVTASSGQVSARCWIEEGADEPQAELVCSAEDHPGLASIQVEVTPAEGEAEILTLGGDPIRRALDPDSAFPLELGVDTEVAEGVAGMERLRSRVHHATLEIAAPEETPSSDPVTAALPFEVWTIDLVAGAELLAFGLDLMPRVLELGPNWGERFAVQLRREPGPQLSPGGSATLLVAVTTGSSSLEANAFLVDGEGNVTDDIELSLTPGTWEASASGVTQVAP